MPTYNKLVRNRIPDIIANSGKKHTTEILDDTRYIRELKKKLNEEVAEYQNAESDEEALEELSDILELMTVLASIHGGSIEEIEQIRKVKAAKRGGFDDKIFLIDVED